MTTESSLILPLVSIQYRCRAVFELNISAVQNILSKSQGI